MTQCRTLPAITASLCLPMLLSVGLLLAGCEAINPETDPAANPPATKGDITRGQAKVVNVDQYFSQYTFGPTLRLYDFRDSNTILALRFSNRTAPVDFTAALHEFFPGTPRKNIDKWINNQHSDALYGDAAEPSRTTNVKDRISIRSERKMREDITPGRSGESYIDYEVTFRVRPIKTETGQIDGFTDNTIVHVLVKPL